MSIPARVEGAVKGIVLWMGVGVAALTTSLAGLGFLIAGFFLWIKHFVREDAAAALTGGVLIFIALLGAAIGKSVVDRIKRRQPTMMQEIGGIAGIAGTVGRIAALLIRKDPKKSLILAVLAGAVAEYITSGGNRQK